MTDFQKGDVVQLKSGGPHMTIQTLGDYSSTGGSESSAHCVWFEKSKAEQKVFDVAVLAKVDDRNYSITSI